MNTLIVYATKHGCTENCAAILSEKLMGKVDLCNLKIVKAVDFSQYDKVIIGGSIYMGKIQKEVSKFCSKNFNLLKHKKVGLFICCMREDIAEMQLNNSFQQELLSNAVVKEFFGGEFIFKKMNVIERFIVKRVSKIDKDISNILAENINKFAQSMNSV